MKPDLSGRLKRLKMAQKVSGSTAGKPKSGEDSPEKTLERKDAEQKIDLKGEWTVLDRDLWMRKRICPSPLNGFHNSGLLCAEYPDPSRWLFYDTETTGLSGGAGNTAFLVGLGRPLGKYFEIIQYFLRDYPGEPALLARLKKDIEEAELFISYNGKSFDKPLLETRFLMNRMPCRMGAQLDLLYPVRALFKDVFPNCRLGTAEEEFLDIHRQGDIPGAEIPDIWFSFLKDGRHPDMDRVIEHNDMDIHSLAVLLKALEDFLLQPDRYPVPDPYALGRFLLDRDRSEGMAWLKQAVEQGSRKGEVLLSVHLKRQGKWDEAAALWEKILSRRLSPFAAVELAKYLEHKKKDYPQALELMDTLLRELPIRRPEERQAHIHRRDRLLRKIQG